ncbi:hypothetical protein ACQ4PT_010390 [Festuca glaucescens]
MNVGRGYLPQSALRGMPVVVKIPYGGGTGEQLLPSSGVGGGASVNGGPGKIVCGSSPNDAGMGGRVGKKGFMAILDQHCAEENAKLAGDSEGVKSEYDFLYVPIDFETRYNKGYAFVNMTTAVAARRLHAHLDGHRWEVVSSKKVCDVVHARVEGLDSLVAHFSGSRFPCGGQKEFLPVRFVPPRDGVRKTAEHIVGRLLHRRHG